MLRRDRTPAQRRRVSCRRLDEHAPAVVAFGQQTPPITGEVHVTAAVPRGVLLAGVAIVHARMFLRSTRSRSWWSHPVRRVEIVAVPIAHLDLTFFSRSRPMTYLVTRLARLGGSVATGVAGTVSHPPGHHDASDRSAAVRSVPA